MDFENIDSLFNEILLEYIDKKYPNDSNDNDNDNNNQNEMNKDEKKSFSLINSQSINENSKS